MVDPSKIRPSKELRQFIDEVRAHYIIKGQKPPSINKITKALMIKTKIKKEDLIYDDAIFFN